MELSSGDVIAKSTINKWIKDIKEIKVDEIEVMILKEEFLYDLREMISQRYTELEDVKVFLIYIDFN